MEIAVEMEKKKYVKYGIIFSSIVIALWLGYWWWISSRYCSFETRGQFGDMFGAINALFTGLAFAGLIVTIILQTQELGLQRDELKATRVEFKEQNKTLTLQRFENTFFSLISLHHQIVDSIDYTYSRDKEMTFNPRDFIGQFTGETITREKETITLKGRDVFKFLYEEKNLKSDLMKVDNPRFICDTYLPHFRNIQTDFKHYFRNLYRIIKLVDGTDFMAGQKLSEKEIHEIKYKYTSIIRAQLSPFEIIWLFYNTLARVQNENPDRKFYDLIVRYTLFKGFPTKELALEAHKNYFDQNAFSPPGDLPKRDPFD